MPEQLILVVEDEPTLAEAVAAWLRAERFAVQVAADGPAAVVPSAAMDRIWWSWTSCCPASTGSRSAGGSRPSARCRC